VTAFGKLTRGKEAVRSCWGAGGVGAVA